jgi:hypothetical protein
MATLGVLLLTLVGAAPAPRGGVGEASTSLQLLRLDITDLPAVGDVGAAAGTLATSARTRAAASAALSLEGLRVGDTALGDWSADADDGPASGDVTVPLAGPGVDGGVSLVDWLADAGDGTATAQLAALTGGLDAGPLGLAVALGERGVSSEVTRVDATGVTEVAIDGLRVTVGDLLPSGVLEQLPLGLALDLLGDLPIDLDADLVQDIAEVEALVAALTEVVALDAEAQATFAELRALFAEDPDVIAAEQAVADAEQAVAAAVTAVDEKATQLSAALTDLEAARAAADDAAADLSAAEDEVAALTEVVSAIDAELADATADLDSLDGYELLGLLELQALLTTLEAEHGAEAGCGSFTVSTDLLTLQGIAACYQTYLEGLVERLSVELVAAEQELQGAIVVRDDLQVAADAAAATVADLELVVAGLEAELADLQATLDAAYAELADASATLEAAIEDVATSTGATDLLDPYHDLLAQLVAAADAVALLLPGVPDLDALRDRIVDTIGATILFDVGRLAIEARTSATADAASATVTCTATDVRVLGAAPLPEVECGVLGAALVDAGDVLRELLGSLPVDVPVDVAFGGPAATTDVDEDAEVGVTAASASVSALRARVGSVGLAAVDDVLTGELAGLIEEASAIVGDDLTALAAAVAALPTGDGLAGLRTVGIDLEVAAVDVRSDFAATPTDAGGPDGDEPKLEAPDDPGAGGDETPDGDGSGGDEPAAPGDDPGDAPAGPDDDPTRGEDGPAGSAELPRTGGGVSLLALVLVLAAVLGRPRRR